MKFTSIFAVILQIIGAQASECNQYLIKKEYQNKSPWVSREIEFQSGFHGNYNLSCAEFKRPTVIKQKFPKNVFIDIDELRRLTFDHTSSLFGKLDDIEFEKYPVDIEAAVWFEQDFWVKFTCRKAVAE